MKEKMKKYEKLEAIKEEKYESKDYLKELTLEKARINFRLRSRLVRLQ